MYTSSTYQAPSPAVKRNTACCGPTSATVLSTTGRTGEGSQVGTGAITPIGTERKMPAESANSAVTVSGVCAADWLRTKKRRVACPGPKQVAGLAAEAAGPSASDRESVAERT